MQIISGNLKGQRIITSGNGSYRPTTARVKEAIFNILSNGCFVQDGKSVLEDSITIDLFAGTGALTFESLSRGAKHSVLIEKNLQNLHMLKQNIKNLNLGSKIDLIKGDATNLPHAKIKCTLAFIDPPFNQGLVGSTLNSLIKKGWLAHQAIVVIETHYKDLYDSGDLFVEIDSREYGHALLKIYQFLGA